MIHGLLTLSSCLLALSSLAAQSGSRNAVVLGRVVNAHGKRVADATVEWLRGPNETLSREFRAWVGNPRTVAGSVKTRRDGRFKIRVDGSGRYALIARRGEDEMSLVHENIAPGQTITLKLQPAVKIVGQVLDVADDGSERPLPNAEINYSSFSIDENESFRHGIGPWAGTLQAGADGRFSFRAPRGAQLGLVATGAGGFGETEIEAGKAQPLIRVRGKLMHGRLTKNDGTPIAGARISLGTTRRGPALGASDAKGEFKLRVPKESAIVLAEAEGHGPTVMWFDPSEDHGRNNQLSATPLAAHRTTGRLLDASDKPLADHPVLLHCIAYGDLNAPYATEVRTDSDGRFDCKAISAAFSVSIWTRVGESWVSIYHGRKEADIELGEVRVSANAKVQGTVVDSTGSPAAFATVMLRPELSKEVLGDNGFEPPITRVLFADQAGRFDIGGLPPGNHEVLCLGQPFVPASRTFRAAARAKRARIAMTLADTIRGIVRAPDGTPIKDATVYSGNEDVRLTHYETFGVGGGQSRTDAAGRFIVPCFEDEPQRLLVFHDEFRSTSIKPVGPGTKDVDVQLERKN